MSKKIPLGLSQTHRKNREEDWDGSDLPRHPRVPFPAPKESISPNPALLNTEGLSSILCDMYVHAPTLYNIYEHAHVETEDVLGDNCQFSYRKQNQDFTNL